MDSIPADTADEALIPILEHPIRLPAFEGPLDLLLFLIRRNEVDIYDIPIETVTRQYLDILRAMDQLSLDVAGEFFVMAATLMYIKSRMLLPKNEELVQAQEDEEAIDPRWELVQQLIQYKKFKEAAGELEERILSQQNLLPRLYREKDEAKDVRPLQPSDHIELWNVFNLVLRRLAEQMVQGEIQDEQVTVSDRMEYVLDLLQTQKTFLFSSLLPGKTSLAMLVSTFLAILELTRLRKLTLQQNETFSDIICYAVDSESLTAEQEPALQPESVE